MFIKRKVKGSMSVEATFIITWTVFLFVFLIYLSFYTYDKCILFQDAYAVCFRGSIQKEENKCVSYINENIQKQFGKKYFGTGTVSGSVSKQGRKLSVFGECAVKVPIHAPFTMWDASGFQIKTEAKTKILNPTKMIRQTRMVAKILGQQRGNEDYCEKSH